MAKTPADFLTCATEKCGGANLSFLNKFLFKFVKGQFQKAKPKTSKLQNTDVRARMRFSVMVVPNKLEASYFRQVLIENGFLHSTSLSLHCQLIQVSLSRLSVSG